jgi:hypothetical protein
MGLNVRPLEIGDYENILVGWWQDWGFSVPPKEFLPVDALCGMIVYDDDTPVCAGFIYFTNASVAWIDWVISNKQYRKKPHRSEAINKLVDSLTDVAKYSGFKFAYALIKNDKLVSRYEKLGYTKGGSYTEEMIKVLHHGT